MRPERGVSVVAYNGRMKVWIVTRRDWEYDEILSVWQSAEGAEQELRAQRSAAEARKAKNTSSVPDIKDEPGCYKVEVHEVRP